MKLLATADDQSLFGASQQKSLQSFLSAGADCESTGLG